MAAIAELTDEELRKKLIEHGYPVGPVTDSTRKILHKKLGELMNGPGQKKKKPLSAYSSGEDEDESQASRDAKAMQPPKSTAKSNRRKTMGNLL
jgi:membrane protein Man1